MDATLDRRINLYEILQVSSKASPEVVQAAYRALARAYHPDLNSSPDAARQMRQLNAAYSVLSDAARRARYDAVRGRPLRARGEVRAEQRYAATASTANGMAPRMAPARPSPAPIASPPRGGLRLGRMVGALAFLFVFIGALVYALYFVAGILEEEPTRAMPPSAQITRFMDSTSPASGLNVPSDVISSARSHGDGSTNFGGGHP